MKADITPLMDKPLWPLSSYGPAKHEPVVVGGLDESPEELRLKAVTALKAGTTDEYTKYEGQKTTTADQVYANVRDNVKQLYDQALRVSTQTQTSAFPSVPTLTTSTPSAFGTSSMQSAFGGTTATSFGKPAFGQPTFGQTAFAVSPSGTSASSQGAQGTSAFGAPPQQASAFSQASQTTSAFGQPTQLSSVFGQPSALGATTQPASALAQPSTQPTSAFGKLSQPTSVFGQPSQPTSAFGQPSQPTSAFSQPSQPASAFSQSPQSAFGQPSQPAFGQSSLIKPASGAFGATGGGGFSTFASQPSAFTSGTPATGTTPAQSAFGTAPPVQSAFGTALSAPKSSPGTSQPSPFGTSFSNTLSVSVLPSPGGNTAFATSPMTVTPSAEKPASGVPDFASAKLVARMKPGADRYLALLPNDYEEVIPADVKAAFAGTKFEWGKIPDWIPPEGVR
ncbi:hypothetical protein L210DRAFT_3650092 [Boletus edulis BED1]|uniref:Uncharacterized protein n=1 Tax=Boletus edulis BED1 TaxID=1328754 RepID=A0AAD4GB04_BOLED|nr:hypothetical protein L210DRAFT_3650092 [Boletus edulis BED1]